MQLPRPRGPLSATVRDRLEGDGSERHPPGSTGSTAVEEALLEVADPVTDDDLQLALCMLYELHYHGFEGVDDGLEWAPAVLAVRRQLERRLEPALRRISPPPALDMAGSHDRPLSRSLVEALVEATSTDGRPELSTYLSRDGTREQFEEFLVARSLQQLKEADAQTWLIPRLSGAAKAALVEIQIDEYGSGRAGHLHSELYALAMRACGLDSSYGAYLDRIPGRALAVGNAMTMLGLHRRLRGAAAGYFAAFEATSSIPSQGYADAAARLDLPAEAALYFTEHVEADAVHEQLAIRTLCAGLVEAEPALADDILWGAGLCMALEDQAADGYLTAWQAGRSCLLGDPDADSTHDAVHVNTRRHPAQLDSDRQEGARDATPSVA